MSDDELKEILESDMNSSAPLSPEAGERMHADLMRRVDQEEAGSQVARLLNQIEQEYTAAFQGMKGLTQGTTRHSFITARMERMGELNEELRKYVGEQGTVLVAARLDQIGRQASP